MTTTERPALADLADPAVLPDPYPVLAALRDASPFAVADGALVVVGRHEDCSRILRDPRASSERNRSLLAPPEMRAQRAPSFLSLDPPDHTRLRRLVAKAFAPRVIAGLEPRIRQLCDDLLDAGRPAWRTRSSRSSSPLTPRRPQWPSRPGSSSPTTSVS